MGDRDEIKKYLTFSRSKSPAIALPLAAAHNVPELTVPRACHLPLLGTLAGR